MNLSFACFFVILFNFTQSKDTATVKIENGQLIGERRGHYFAFEGIPYAKAPVGKLRFKPPRSYTEKWPIPRNATIIGEACMQWDHFAFDKENKVTGSEDCLFVNVYTPNLSKETKMPVFVYIHGGAFMFGHGDIHGPEMITKRNGILVNFNYRLGPLGFLTTESKLIPGNMGLKDQVQVLKWVQKNIASFGGDPEQVTITGFSAGGASVHLHYMSPLSVGLFKNGIAHSGCALNPWVFMENGLEKTQKIASVIGCEREKSIDMIRCLRNASAEEIVGTVKEFQPWLYNPFSPFGVVVEAKKTEEPFLNKEPVDLIDEGEFLKLPLIFSATSAEGLYPAGEFARKDKNYIKEINEKWDEIMPHVLDFAYTPASHRPLAWNAQQIREHYMKNEPLSEKNFNKFVEIISDRLFNYGLGQAARAHSSIAPTFFYHFRYKTEFGVGEAFSNGNKNIKFGVAHGEDIHLIYSNPFRDASHPYTADEKRMTELLLDLYYSFAKTGQPIMGDFEVPQVEFNDEKTLKHTCIEGPDSLAVAVAEDFGQESFWEGLMFEENKKHVDFKMQIEKPKKINFKKIV